MKKTWQIITPPSSPATIVEPASARSRSMPRGIIGDRERCSMATKAASRTMAAA